MASSKIDHESGIVTVTTPGAGCSVGDRFYVMSHAATFGIAYSDWVLRLVAPQTKGGSGKPWGEGVDVRPAEEALLESLRNGSVHPSLAAEPKAA
jgi:hypothetical protein